MVWGIFNRRTLVAKPSEILKKTKMADKDSEKDDKKKPSKNAMLSWIAAKKK